MGSEKQRQNLKHLIPNPFLPGSALFPTSVSSNPKQCLRRMGNGGCGQSITAPLCCPFLLSLFPCSSVGCPWDSVPSRNTQLLQPIGCSMDVCSGMVSLRAVEESMLCCLKHLLPHFSDLVAHRIFSFSPSHSLLCSWGVLPFLKRFQQRHHHLAWGAQLCPAVGGWSHWNRLCPAWNSPSLSSQRLPAAHAARAWAPAPCTPSFYKLR